MPALYLVGTIILWGTVSFSGLQARPNRRKQSITPSPAVFHEIPCCLRTHPHSLHSVKCALDFLSGHSAATALKNRSPLHCLILLQRVQHEARLVLWQLRMAHGADFFISRVLPSIMGSGNLSPDRPDSDYGTRDKGRTALHTLALNNRSPSVSVPEGHQGTLTRVRSWEMPICPDLLPLLFLLKAFRSPSEDGHQRRL